MVSSTTSGLTFTGQEVSTRVLRTADVLAPEEADLERRRVAHLLESDASAIMDSDDLLQAGFLEGYEDEVDEG